MLKSLITRKPAQLCLLQAVVLNIASLASLIRSWEFVHVNLISPAWFDLWIWVDDFQRWTLGKFSFHDFVKPHYEHRIAPARVLLLIDSALFDMHGWLPALCNLVFLILTGLLLWRFVSAGAATRQLWTLSPLFWMALVSSVCQIGNLISPFQVAISSACLSAVITTSLLSLATASLGTTRAAWLAAAAGLIDILADFSLAGCIFLAPALLVLLLLRRAALVIWCVFTPLAVLGWVLFFHHYARDQTGVPPILDAHLTVLRLLYVGNFLASSLNYFSNVATFAGLCGAASFLLACSAIARLWLRGKPVAPGDAALVALGLFLLLCAAAGTLTFRLTFGARAALVDRYATMSLLFVAVLFGLLIRWSVRAATPGWVQRVAVPSAGLLMLYAFNLPYYDRAAASLRRVANADADLLVNNVAVQGPAPVIFMGTPDDVRDRVIFLHQQRINMFAPDNRPPADLLAKLHGPGPWPACRGYVDHAYGIDDTGFMLRAWLADPQGRHTAPWMAALDGQGTLLGTARAFDERPDVSASLGMPAEAFGFTDGFRLQHARRDPGATVAVHIAGLFPGESQPVCTLAMPAAIGPVLIEPVAKLSDLTPAPLTTAPEPGDFVPWHGTADVAPAAVPAGTLAWGVATPGQPGRVLRFHADGPSHDRALALPFVMAYESPGARIGVLFADGTRVGIDLPSLFGRREWRAAVLPPALLARHPGPVTLEVQGAGDPWLVVGEPLLVALRPEWSKIF